jgi:hypothetical protein
MAEMPSIEGRYWVLPLAALLLSTLLPWPLSWAAAAFGILGLTAYALVYVEFIRGRLGRGRSP